MKTSTAYLAGAASLAALAGGLAAAPASAQSFSAVTYFDGQFLSVDGASGTAAPAGALGAGVRPDGLASYNGSLYTFDTKTDSLLRLNAATGGTLASFSVGIPGVVAPGGLAISSSGLAYLADPLTSSPQSAPASALYSFSLTGGPAVKVGTTSDLLSGLAFNANDTLYGLGKGDGQVYTINTASAKESLVGNLDPANSSIGNDPIAALTFSGGTLYAAADSSLYTVNTATGAGTLVGPISDGIGAPFSSVSGLAPAAPVPEASSVISFGALLVLGGVFLIRRRARRS